VLASSQCTACPGSSTTSSTGQSSCDACLPGSGGLSCAACPVGQFSDTVALKSVGCRLCSTGTTTAAAGALACTGAARPLSRAQHATGMAFTHLLDAVLSTNHVVSPNVPSPDLRTRCCGSTCSVDTGSVCAAAPCRLFTRLRAGEWCHLSTVPQRELVSRGSGQHHPLHQLHVRDDQPSSRLYNC
jgi:hypothetical protein